MASTVEITLGRPGAQPGLGRGEWQRTLHILARNRLVLAGSVLVVLVVLTALLAGAIAPYDPIANNVRTALQPPSAYYVFGTDRYGHDIFSRVVFGSQISLAVALVSVAVAATSGTLLGLASGFFDVSTTMIGSGMGWGPTVEPYNAYLNDKINGATMLSIALGHAADALCHRLGEIRQLSATMTVRRATFTIAETGESKPMTADDQLCVSGLLEGGAALSIHYRGGRSRGTNLLWEINGTEGDLQLTAAGGQAQIFEMDVRGGQGAQSSLEILPVPERYRWAPPQVPGPATNVAQAYARFARDYREGTHFCPTFDDAVTRHRMLNAIETAAATGQRQTLG